MLPKKSLKPAVTRITPYAEEVKLTPHYGGFVAPLARNKMKLKRLLLLIDSIINLVLGVLLLSFPRHLVKIIGIPTSESSFYPSILGSVLFGIGIALLLQRYRANGLALAGAVSINLCGGIVLGIWLLFGGLHLPLRGLIFLWSLVIILVGISTIEIVVSRIIRNDH